jgi:hypothetical protein
MTVQFVQIGQNLESALKLCYKYVLSVYPSRFDGAESKCAVYVTIGTLLNRFFEQFCTFLNGVNQRL